VPQLGEALDPGLREELAAVGASVALDEGGGATSLKVFLLAELIITRELHRIVEIGVYRGRLFLPLARLISQLGRGEVVGIDPWSAAEAVQHDAELPEIDLVAWPETVDWDGIYEDVRAGMRRWEVEDRARLLRARSEDVAGEFEGAPIDLLHVDGNHDREAVARDLDLYLPLMRDGGLLVMDDVGWPSVRSAYEELAERHQPLFRITESGAFLTPADGGNDFAVLQVRQDR
jgi:hypothetical protein